MKKWLEDASLTPAVLLFQVCESLEIPLASSPSYLVAGSPPHPRVSSSPPILLIFQDVRGDRVGITRDVPCQLFRFTFYRFIIIDIVILLVLLFLFLPDIFVRDGEKRDAEKTERR